MKDRQIHSELNELLKEKNRLCVSLILPLHKDPSFQKSDRIIIDHAIQKLGTLLDSQFKPAIVDTFVAKLMELKGKINLEAGMQGIGIFISPRIIKVVQFPFPVKEKILAADSFETRDVLYKEFYAKDYFVLKLTNNKARLLKGRGTALTEIKNEDFPVQNIDDYEYARPSRGNSFGHTLKSFERDKSNMKEIRAEKFYHDLDKKLNKYLHRDVPLVVAGVKKDIGYFEKESENREHIAGHVLGSYDGYNSEELRTYAWEEVQHDTKRRERKLISDLKEMFGRKLVTIGIPHVWRDARAGKGNILVVEKDLSRPAFIGEDPDRLLFRQPKGDHKIINDAVDEIMETVMQKNGKIIFVDNLKLREFEGIALIKRY